MTFPRIWIAWLLALVFGFAAPAQAMRGLTRPGTPLGAKSHRVNNPINYIDPEGLNPVNYRLTANVLLKGTKKKIVKFSCDATYETDTGVLTLSNIKIAGELSTATRAYVEINGQARTVTQNPSTGKFEPVIQDNTDSIQDVRLPISGKERSLPLRNIDVYTAQSRNSTSYPGGQFDFRVTIKVTAQSVDPKSRTFGHPESETQASPWLFVKPGQNARPPMLGQ